MITIKTFLNECSEKAKQHQELLILIAVVGAFIIILLVLTFAFLLIFPMWQVSRFGLNNVTLEATFENQYRTTLTQIIATFAQILGGGAVAIGIYFAWGNLITARDGQITERFTRAVDQFGNEKMEIRLGGIYALKRIANESEKDYWPIMEILTAYVRKNSQNTHSKEDIKLIKSQIKEGVGYKEFIKNEKHEPLKPDIKAILTFIKENKYPPPSKYPFPSNNKIQGFLDLSETNLPYSELATAHLESATLERVFLLSSFLFKTQFTNAFLFEAVFIYANLRGADFQGANLRGADFEGASLIGANFKGAKNLTIDQLSKVETLYKTKLDDELLIPLKEKYPALFEKPEL